MNKHDDVIKEFFKNYRELFLELKGSLEEILKKDKNVREEFEEKNISTIDFSKKLLEQIVFIYFLQEKGWLGVQRASEWGTGPRNFLHKLFNGEVVSYDNFFNDVLEPLFYEALTILRDGDYYNRFNCKIPFLNTDLFKPINNYNWTKTNIILDNSIFKKILSTFDRFTFTIEENGLPEKEATINPEILEKVFENLLETEDKKSKGTFYTPKEIVHYMCQQSLISYLKTNTSIPYKDIEKFIQIGDIPENIEKNHQELDELFKKIKIVDPACGSGAFLIGMLDEIVKARSLLRIFSDEEQNNYNIKREIIENCLYGVDLDSFAVDITKLRLWLSLIADEKSKKNIKPLPNLDHKIVCGNSLIG